MNQPLVFSDQRSAQAEVTRCMECGAEILAASVRLHFKKIHTSPEGTPLWEHGAAELMCRPGAD